MASTICAAIFLIIGLSLYISGKRSKPIVTNANSKSFYEDDSAPSKPFTIKLGSIFKGVGLTFIGLSLVIMAFSVFTTVSAKNAGVLVAFGRVSEKTLSPGLHMKAPWQKVIEIDGTIQTDEYFEGGCIQVRIGDGSETCVSITNRWNILESEADRVYQDFKSNDPTESFKSAVISTELKASLQKAIGDYNPIAQFEGVNKEASSTELSFSPDYDAISRVVEADMVERLKGKKPGEGPMAEIQGVTISFMKLSPNTQSKLDDYVAAIGETRIAEQKKQTAAAQAEANKALSGSVSNNPNVLVSKCLDTLAESSVKGYQLPAGFSCWPGGGSAVVVPSAQQPTG